MGRGHCLFLLLLCPCLSKGQEVHWMSGKGEVVRVAMKVAMPGYEPQEQVRLPGFSHQILHLMQPLSLNISARPRPMRGSKF